jgi:hypothetical protein
MCFFLSVRVHPAPVSYMMSPNYSRADALSEAWAPHQKAATAVGSGRQPRLRSEAVVYL